MSTISTSTLDYTKRISWGSIFAGVITVIAVSLVLSLLGISMGFALLDPQSTTDIGNGSGTALTVWTLISLLISLAAGGFVAGRLAGIDGIIHGFLTWALSLLVGVILSVMTLSSALSVTGSAVGSIASATGSVASGLGSVAGKGASQAWEMGQDVFKDIMPKDGIDVSEKQNQTVLQALQKSGVPQLQPDYLNHQLDFAKDQTQIAARKIVTNPQQSQQIIQELLATLQQRAQEINQSISKDDLKKAIANNSSLSDAEADQAVDNFLQERERAIQALNQKLDQLQVNIQQAQQEYEKFKQQAAEAAAVASNKAAKAALWSFFGLVLGAIISSALGFWGVNSDRKRRTLEL